MYIPYVKPISSFLVILLSDYELILFVINLFFYFKTLKNSFEIDFKYMYFMYYIDCFLDMFS